MATDWSVVVHKGQLQAPQGLSAAEFLRCHPPGAYTTTRTMDQASCLLFWERHLARLFQSMRLVAEAMPSLYPKEIRHSSCTWENDLKQEIHSSLRVALARALELKRMNDEIVISILAVGSTESSELHPWQIQGYCDLFVHLTHYVTAPQVSLAHLAVMGPGRNLSLAKLSLWAKTRQVLEQLKPRNTTEVLLSSDGHRLLEGLLTNFFVVVNITPTTHEENKEQIENCTWQDVELQTAPLEKGVLPGVLRKIVLEIALERNIRFREVAPLWEDRHTWKEAFITSSVRLVQPVMSIQSPIPWNGDFKPENWLKCHWERFEFKGRNTITEIIKDDVILRARKDGVLLESLVR